MAESSFETRNRASATKELTFLEASRAFTQPRQFFPSYWTLVRANSSSVLLHHSSNAPGPPSVSHLLHKSSHRKTHISTNMADGCYPRLNASLIQSQQYNGCPLASVVGTIQHVDMNSMTAQLKCCDGGFVSMKLDPDYAVQMMGPVSWHWYFIYVSLLFLLITGAREFFFYPCV